MLLLAVAADNIDSTDDDGGEATTTAAGNANFERKSIDKKGERKNRKREKNEHPIEMIKKYTPGRERKAKRRKKNNKCQCNFSAKFDFTPIRAHLNRANELKLLH